MGIFIFSKPIHSGKTTALINWCRHQKNVQGILMPDVNGQRMFFNIATQQLFAAQCIEADTNEELVAIGKYNFFTKAFKQANNILLQALTSTPDWLVIDEIGKLEMLGKGFYDSAEQIINHYKNSDENLLLVVRDSLVKDVVAFFGIKKYTIMNQP